jgi:toxin ParE1/3/4
MNRSYTISPTAIKDLKDILNYFFERNINAGEAFADAFERKCGNIVNFPNMGRSYEELAPSLRGIPIDGYIIFYTVTEESIEIARVVSGSRDLSNLFSEADD